MATIAGLGITFIIAAFLIVVLLMFFLLKFLGWALAPFMGNIVAGGILYFLIDAFRIVTLDWSFFDAVVVAVFGVPGTLFLAVWEALF